MCRHLTPRLPPSLTSPWVVTACAAEPPLQPAAFSSGRRNCAQPIADPPLLSPLTLSPPKMSSPKLTPRLAPTSPWVVTAVFAQMAGPSTLLIVIPSSRLTVCSTAQHAPSPPNMLPPNVTQCCSSLWVKTCLQFCRVDPCCVISPGAENQPRFQ